MEYILISFPALLVVWCVGIALFSRAKLKQPRSLVQPGEIERLRANRFISQRAFQNLQQNRVRRASAAAKVAAAPQVAHIDDSEIQADAQTAMHSGHELTVACLSLLDAVAIEHPAAHTKLAARYILRSKDDDRIELMFEMNGSGWPKLWLTHAHARQLTDLGIKFRSYPASALYQSSESGGKLSYGRHAALKSMRDLANADLVRFTIDRPVQLQAILMKLAEGA